MLLELIEAVAHGIATLTMIFMCCVCVMKVLDCLAEDAMPQATLFAVSALCWLAVTAALVIGKLNAAG